MKISRFALLLATLLSATAPAAELVRLTPVTWDEFVPNGKEVDAIYGDFVLRNDKLIAVIAEPVPTRNANMTVRNVGGMIIDLTRRSRQSDQLSVYKPNAMPLVLESPDTIAIKVDGEQVEPTADLNAQGETLVWACSTKTTSGLEVTVRYTLRDGEDFIAAETVLQNESDSNAELELSDYIRADRTFAFGNDDAIGLFWAADDWFGQAYGVIVEGRDLRRGGGRGSVLRMQSDESANIAIPAGESHVVRRKIFPGGNLLELRSLANRLAGQPGIPFKVQITDPAGPVAHAKVVMKVADQQYAAGRTDERGELRFDLPQKEVSFEVSSIGRGKFACTHTQTGGFYAFHLPLEEPGYVVGNITAADGGPLPCKVAFHGLDDTPTPDFGPDSGAVAVKNLHYSHNGQFRQVIGPGKYEAIISYGPEYDAVFQTIEVKRGEETKLAAKLQRVVDTKGWVSSDFHSHSTPSGDNTSMQLGRILNLLCEHVEFCPCTEHNRIDTYVPHLKQLGVEKLMATCTGMELTQSLGTVNHQNAFPLLFKPRTQDGGAPVTDENPVAQIERLALWDDGSDKLVQENHPNLVQILGDKDLDGKPDGGFEGMFAFMDVIEVHPPEGIFQKPEKDERGRLSRNPIFHWMQMLNLGYRIPGVVNTDAHYNFHESGWLRNYLHSPTDDPAQIETMDMVHAAEQGHVVMSTGPFMEVRLKSQQPSDKPAGIPGDDVIAPLGKATLCVRVQCPNWLDVNRVQVFLNGRAAPELNFTRRETPDRFSDKVIKFDSALALDLAADTHVIVAAIGEGQTLGRVMGPVWGKRPPVAVANPIFVDVDGEGFEPNKDLLDVPLPLAGD